MNNEIIYEKCSKINDLLNNGRISEARSDLIRLLDTLKDNKYKYSPLLNHLIREVGLFPYIDEESADWQDRMVYEVFKTDVGDLDMKPLHIEQSYVLKRLLKGENLVVSAPTSFGKSFIIDAYIAMKKPTIVFIIVPTIALADETRRRLHRKFSSSYKIVTTTDAKIQGNTIFVFPQERAFAYIDIVSHIDIMIIDEFYKASDKFDDDRSEILLNTMIELGKKTQQRYYLTPNIDNLENSVLVNGMTFLKFDFKTVESREVHLYSKKKNSEKNADFKKRELIDLVKSELGKTLIYAGSYSNIDKIASILNNEIEVKGSKLLHDFGDWLSLNYGETYSMIPLVEKGIGIHNGRLHRSLSQIQVKLFEQKDGLDKIVSTSSIIEGVNTQAESVILWINKNGKKKIDFFTFKNITGRAGRMFRHFVGNVYMLEAPPAQDSIILELGFPEDVTKNLDSDNPGVQLNNQQYKMIKDYQDEMIHLLGLDKWKELRQIPQVRYCNPNLLKNLIIKIIEDKNWPRNFKALLNKDGRGWEYVLGEIVFNTDIVKDRKKQKQLVSYICLSSCGWNISIPDILRNKALVGISIENLFEFERFMTFNIASRLSLINTIKLVVYEDSPDISPFIHRLSNAFLPKLFFQLEEYGLPRMVSKKIQDTGLIDLLDDEKEICDVVNEFIKIGCDKLKSSIKDIHPFENFILNYFYEGISSLK